MSESVEPRPPKPVVQVIVDALASRVVRPALEDGKLPHIAKLVEREGVRWDCTSIFPSITPAATCALTTGQYPDRTHIAGAYWYDPEEKDVAYFGDDIWTILAENPGEYVNDFQIGLNFHRLKADTVFEMLEEAGHPTAALNSMWFRGPHRHEISPPAELELAPGVEFAKELTGPTVLTLADFCRSGGVDGGPALEGPGGPTRRYGFHDQTTSAFLLNLFGQMHLPAYTLAYFPNNDFVSHEDGPRNAVHVLEKLDRTLGGLFALFGGVEKFLETFAFLMTGDHSQTDCAENPKAREIDLTDVLAEFTVVHGGESWKGGEDILACPNMRAAQLYLSEDGPSLETVRDALLRCERVDQVIWRTPIHRAGGPGPGEERTTFHVATAERGTLRFTPADGPEAAAAPGWKQAVDDYGNRWRYEGDLAALDGAVTAGEDGADLIRFKHYPNAFERIATSFFQESGALWATAIPGAEFRLPRTTTHAGGSHGSLHLFDSASPLIFGGLPDDVIVPEHPRTVDVVPLAMRCLHVQPPWEPGQGRVCT
ncbi:alkaline phosphatase family protein [Alienimonas californiensis]|uniref:Type I phosphodiesterase / nucleotide pyrophosphatase n=1 Tax=Alienimonas californiensis TaxID=2527989 RepID=A0A517PCG1_9PLAN|nr:alkaline phosphatase family protein [Alienimonas californiensis]QDT17078.1 Type I phosphodiesterase / nucleotide pyrophosphatase [Alienimonas californiensis]